MSDIDTLIIILGDEDEPLDRRILHGVAHLARELDATREDLKTILNKENLMSDQQDAINAAITALQDTDNGLDAAATRIEAKLAELAGQGVDVSGLTAEVENLRSHAAAVEGIVPETPAP